MSSEGPGGTPPVPPPDGASGASIPSDPAASVVVPVDLTQLVREHHVAVYRYAYRLSGNVAESDDIAQQTFLIAHQKLDQLREPDKAIGWLLAIARSCFLKNRRKRLPLSAGDVDYDVESIPEDAQAESEVDPQRLQTALDRLPLEPRMVLMLFYFEDCSYKEIADKLSIPIGTVMSRLSRAKEKLKRELETIAEEAEVSRREAKRR